MKQPSYKFEIEFKSNVTTMIWFSTQSARSIDVVTQLLLL